MGLCALTLPNFALKICACLPKFTADMAIPPGVAQSEAKLTGGV